MQGAGSEIGDAMTHEAKARQFRVVCIEDEPEMIELITLMLGKRGFEVTGATSGEEGLETIARVQPDLVLLDLMMPEMNG